MIPSKVSHWLDSVRYTSQQYFEVRVHMRKRNRVCDQFVNEVAIVSMTELFIWCSLKLPPIPGSLVNGPLAF